VTTYATYADVQPRVAGRTISGSTKPTSTEVSQWCTDATSMVVGALNGCGITVPTAAGDGFNIIKSWVCDYAEGRTLLAWSAEDADQSPGLSLIDKFKTQLADILDKPAFYEAMLNGGSGGSSNRVRAYVLSNADDKSIANGDFDPDFDSDTEF